MGNLLNDWGRSFGRASLPAFEKAKWAWQTLAGSEADRRAAELSLGRSLAEEIRREAKPAPASDVALVRGIAEALAARLRDKQWRFQVEVLVLPEPSAVALPGGPIILSVSLLDLCHRYADELAFVVGHEMTHVIRGHAADKFLGDSLLNVVASRLGGATPLGGLLKDTTLQLLASNYSQDCEFEADEFGSRLAEAAGHHPLAGLRLFDRLQRLHQERTPLGQYFSSHPTPAERRVRLGRAWPRRS